MTTRRAENRPTTDLPARPALRASGLTLRVSPSGQLHLDESESDDDTLPPERHHRIKLAFQPGVAAGLLGLALDHADTPLPPSLTWGRDVAAACLQGLVARADDEGRLPSPDTGPTERLAALAARVPPIRGAEYVDSDVVAAVWTEVDAAVRSAVGDHGDFGAWLAARHAARHLVGRVHLHLAEKRGDP
ncbi:MAG: ATP-dependent helicase, partial [Myxococcales bacterium]|nr:ATP-dependent helicase [Myxococcales bacterium]